MSPLSGPIWTVKNEPFSEPISNRGFRIFIIIWLQILWYFLNFLLFHLPSRPFFKSMFLHHNSVYIFFRRRLNVYEYIFANLYYFIYNEQTGFLSHLLCNSFFLNNACFCDKPAGFKPGLVGAWTCLALDIVLPTCREYLTRAQQTKPE